MRWLLLLLVLIVWTAYSQQNAPSEQDSKSTKQKAAPERIGTEERPLVITVRPNESDKKETERREKERRDKVESNWNLIYWTRVLAVLAGLQFLALIIHACIFRSQAKSLRDTIGEMQKATLASERAAFASQVAADAARQEYISSHRPRMRIKHVWLSESLESGKPVMVNIVSVNFGDTEAHIIEFGVVTNVIPKFRHPPNDPFKGLIGIYPMLKLPSGKTLDHSPREAGDVTLSEIDDIRRGIALLYCFAYVEYLDSSNPPIPRKTSCCRVLEPSVGEAMSTCSGVFRRVNESEYEYQD